MKIFTEKGFENRLARERELWEERQRFIEEICNLHRQIDELRLRCETKVGVGVKVNTDV